MCVYERGRGRVCEGNERVREGKKKNVKKEKNKMNELCICGYVDKWIRCG